jgi:hypothetical protein
LLVYKRLLPPPIELLGLLSLIALLYSLLFKAFLFSAGGGLKAILEKRVDLPTNDKPVKLG